MVRETNKDELALREFYLVALAKNLSFVDQASILLEQGCQYLDMRCGIISYVEGDRYTILHVYTATDDYKILSGDVFDLGITYCKFTLEQQQPVAFNHAATTEIAHHPSYEALKLEAYLGAPTYLNEELFGTVNFTRIEARKTKFTESEIYYVKLLAEWFSTQLNKYFRKAPALQEHKDIAQRLKTSAHAIIELSEDYKVIKWSDNAADMLGWQTSQVIDKAPNEWPGVSENDLAELMRSLSAIASAGEDGCAFYLKIIKNNSDLISTEWFLSIVIDPVDKTSRIRAHILDITERESYENELLRTSARYLDLYENAPDMYLSLDQVGNIISANKLCYQTLGYDSQGLLGKPYWNLILKSDIQRIRRLIDVAFKGDVHELEMEASLRTFKNDVIRTHQKITIIQAKKGMPRELRIIARDITERKRGQATRLLHLQQQRDEISHEVQHRIKNSLQAVIGLLTMNIDANPELKPILTTSIAQVNTISIVNDLIFDGKDDIEIVVLFESLLKASSQLFNCQTEFDIQYHSESKIMLISEEVIAVSLVYSELLINAFKYRSQNSLGENYISVSINLYDGSVNLNITNTYSEHSADSSNGSQFGQSMIKMLLPPQGATLNISQDKNYYQVAMSLEEPVVVNKVG